MRNIEQILADNNIEITDEQKEALKKAVAENYKPIADYQKQKDRLEAERDTLKTQLEEAKASLAGFDGVDVEGLQRQIAEAQAKVMEAEENAKNALAARDYQDAVKAQVESLAFTSISAKERFIEKLTEKNLPIEGGKLLGFDDYVSAYKEADAGAIVDKEAADNKAQFTQSVKSTASTAPKDNTMNDKMRAAFGLPPLKED